MTGRPAPPGWPGRSVLAVCAHPDDESFGLGAVLADAASRGAEVSVLCFTAGEASTLGASTLGVGQAPLSQVRRDEFEAAAAVLGLQSPLMMDYPDGGLSGVDVEELAGHVVAAAGQLEAAGILAFDLGGVTGHPDHHRATEAALAAAGRLGLPVTGWAVPEDVALTLNSELGTRFCGRSPEKPTSVLSVDRAVQQKAIACHVSQCTSNPVLWRRLQLQGEREYLVPLRS